MSNLSNRNAWLAIPGLAIVVAFFMPFFSVGGVNLASGLDIAQEAGHASELYLLWLLPIGGLALLFSALAQSKSSKAIGLLTGLGVFLVFAFFLSRALYEGTTWGLWLVMIAGVGMLISSLANGQAGVLSIAGLVIIAGFFLPWLGDSHASVSGFDLATMDFAPAKVKLLWLTPLVGALALVGSILPGKTRNIIGVICGLAVIGGCGFWIWDAATFVMGSGVYVTLASATAALVLSLKR